MEPKLLKLVRWIMSRFDSLRRPMGGFMPRPDIPPVTTVIYDEATTATLHRIEILGRLNARRLEKIMATVDEVLAAVQAQKTTITSMATLLSGIRARLNAALAGELSATAQAKLDEAMSELQGNTRAISDAVLANDDDPTNDPVPPGPKLAATTTTLTSSKPVATVGDTVTLSAGVSPVNPATLSITGSVVFGIQGGDDLGSSALDSTGVAVFNAPTAPGDYDIVATYSGDGNFAVSKSAVLAQSVIAAAPTPTPAPPAPPADQGAGQAPPA